MLSCKELVKRLSEEENMSFFTRVEIRLHLLMCKHCSNYFKQLKYMNQSFKKIFSKIMYIDQNEIQKTEEEVIKSIEKKPRT